MTPIRVGIVGVGKIARDQHIPAIAANPDFELVAAASRNTELAGIANFRILEDMLRGVPDLDAIAICTPPQTHYEGAKLALTCGKHVLLEKPPCTSLAQLDHLRHLAREVRRTLYQTWHSRHAQGVAGAVRTLKERKLRRVTITWKEDVLEWHPGQTWIWQAGGFGVFDPGINALSILTRLVAEPIYPQSARLFVPSNREAPIAAELALVSASGIPIAAALDFRQSGPPSWDIELDTDRGPMHLSAGGSILSVGAERVPSDAGVLASEYASIYGEFSGLIAGGRSDVDARPLELVADIFLIARQIPVAAFVEPRP
ncbi:MAG: Gfo/Idh/MocA family protein [Steroidobacteraceae bacterium]